MADPRLVGKVVSGTATSAKLRAPARFLAHLSELRDDVLATVRVSERGYEPGYLVVRQRISPDSFTAIIPAGHLNETLDDPRVVLVEPSRTLQLY